MINYQAPLVMAGFLNHQQYFLPIGCFECFQPEIPFKVLLKGGRTLDALAVATGVAFDKSGGSEKPWDDSRRLYPWDPWDEDVYLPIQ